MDYNAKRRVQQAIDNNERIPARYCSEAAILRYLNEEKEVEKYLDKLPPEERSRVVHEALIADARHAAEAKSARANDAD